MDMHGTVRISRALGSAIGIGLLMASPFTHNTTAAEADKAAARSEQARRSEAEAAAMSARILAAQGAAGASAVPPGFVGASLFGKMEKAAFLGVSTQPPDESLSRQLGLIKGTGLIVKHVDPNSPADGKLEVHDVLRTFDGQVLVNQEQLAVLVRTNKPGSTVAIELTRASKPVTVTVKLTEKEMPALIRSSTGTVLDPHMLQFLGGTNSPVRIRFGGPSAPDAAVGFPGFGGSSRTVVSHSDGRSGTTTMNTDSHTFTLTTAGDAKTLRVVTRDGKEVFNGPVTTEDDRAKIPASLRDDFKEIDQLTGNIHINVAR